VVVSGENERKPERYNQAQGISVENKIFYIVALTLCGLAIIFGLASIAFPSFREGGPYMVGAILGALVSMGGIIVGTGAAVRYAKREDDSNA
jgi:hypothetical protein